MVSPFEWAEQVEPEWSFGEATQAVRAALSRPHVYRATDGERHRPAWVDGVAVVEMEGHGVTARFYHTHYEDVVRERALCEARALAEIEEAATLEVSS